MGIEFIRARSKGHAKAQTAEFLRASDDLLVGARQSHARTLVFLANVTGDIQQLNPETEVLLQAAQDHLNCYLSGRLVAVVENPPASWLADVSEQPEGYCAGHVEERHQEVGKVSIRITI